MNDFIEQLLDQNSRAFVPKKLRILVEEAAAHITDLTARLAQAESERDALETNYDNGAYVAKLRELHRRASEETGELLARALKAEAERDEALERAHYADGVAELAMKHRDAAEALLAEAVQFVSLLSDHTREMYRAAAPAGNYEGGSRFADNDPVLNGAATFLERAKGS